MHAAFLRLKQLADAKVSRTLIDGNPKDVPFEVLLTHAGDAAKVGTMGGDVYETAA